MSIPLYQELAATMAAYQRCLQAGTLNWIERHEEKLMNLVNNNFPSGSGFNGDCFLDFDKSTGEKLVLIVEYQHIFEDRCYGWSRLTVTVKPSLALGCTIKITGIISKFKHDADYFYDTMYAFFRREI